MFSLFHQNGCADLFIHHAERLALHTAAQDLMGDVLKVSGKTMLKKAYLPVAEKNAVVIGSLENPAFAQWVKPHLNDFDALAQEWEGYRIVVDGSFLIVRTTRVGKSPCVCWSTAMTPPASAAPGTSPPL